jgi:hypothetical protein
MAGPFQRRLKYEKLMDDRRRLTLPLARFAKKVVSWNKIVYIFDRQCIFVVTINRIIFIIFIFIGSHPWLGTGTSIKSYNEYKWFTTGFVHLH